MLSRDRLLVTKITGDTVHGTGLAEDGETGFCFKLAEDGETGFCFKLAEDGETGFCFKREDWPVSEGDIISIEYGLEHEEDGEPVRLLDVELLCVYEDSELKDHPIPA